ncbi:MAG TPA: hypothetical protein VD931_23445 [Baekduia sp.]|nr:hypothetical protein [Baekduia sp.]
MGYDEPTRRLPQQPARGPEVRETVMSTGDDGWRQRLEDRLRSLQTAVAVLSVLTAAALGIALWALLDDEGSSGGTTRGELSNRIERVEERLDDRATKGDVEGLQEDVQELTTKVDEAASRPQEDGGGDDGAAQQAVDDLRTQVEDLQGRVDQLEQSGGGTTTEP